MDGTKLLPEFDQEMAHTRRALERVDETRFDWKPHEKSFTLKDLSAHIARLPLWLSMTLDTSEFDSDAGDFPDTPVESREDLLALFDESVAEARSKLQAASADDLLQSWTLMMGGETAFTLPKTVVLRTWVFNHIVHHRGQLTVYLRLLDIPVPAIYGPSADEEPHP